MFQIRLSWLDVGFGLICAWDLDSRILEYPLEGEYDYGSHRNRDFIVCWRALVYCRGYQKLALFFRVWVHVFFGG
jgi:hypothetical protein